MQKRIVPVGKPVQRLDACRVARVLTVVAALLCLGRAQMLRAASPAFDSAADHAYDLLPGNSSGWLQASNGGYGWGGPWMSSGNTNPGNAIGSVGSSTTNGTGDLDNDGDINTPRSAEGRAWGLASDMLGASNVRALQGAMNYGQTFSIDMDNGLLHSYVSEGVTLPGAVGWSLGSDSAEFKLTARSDSADYVLATPVQRLDTGVPRTYEGIHSELTLLPPADQFTPSRWMLKLTPLSPGSQTTILTGYSSSFGQPAIVPVLNQIGLADYFAGFAGGQGSAYAVYFNNISITNFPEPSSAGLLAAGAALLLRRRRTIRN